MSREHPVLHRHGRPLGENAPPRPWVCENHREVVQAHFVLFVSWGNLVEHRCMIGLQVGLVVLLRVARSSPIQVRLASSFSGITRDHARRETLRLNSDGSIPTREASPVTIPKTDPHSQKRVSIREFPIHYLMDGSSHISKIAGHVLLDGTTIPLIPELLKRFLAQLQSTAPLRREHQVVRYRKRNLFQSGSCLFIFACGKPVRSMSIYVDNFSVHEQLEMDRSETPSYRHRIDGLSTCHQRVFHVSDRP